MRGTPLTYGKTVCGVSVLATKRHRSHTREKGKLSDAFVQFCGLSHIPEVLMLWILFALGAALSWGLYGPTLHGGQLNLGNNSMRALLCVGIAYFLIGVLVPLISLSSQGQLNGFTMKGSVGATIGGALGAAGAVCIIFAFRSGGLPTYVMPLVFAGAPLVNVLYSMWLHPPKTSPNPLLYLGFVLAAVGGGLVLYFKPSS